MNITRLLDFVASLESNGNYNAVFGDARARDDLSKYTLAEIHDMQYRHGKRTGSSAFGRYQFLRKTLLGLRRSLGLSSVQRFTPEMQDMLATELLRRRGLHKWQAGGMSDEAFMDALSKEWASLPYHSGRSYYDGDDMNHSLASRAVFQSVLDEVRNG